jgi:cytidylate kinase
MAVITISRGTFSGGKALAECLSCSLGYRCVDRDMVVERAAARGVSEQGLRAALEKAPTALGTFDHRKYIYLALIQAALAEEVRGGHAIYHGLLGHLLLKGGVGILRLRVIAPVEFRIRMAEERLGLTRNEVIAHIEKVDQDRRKWTQYLYGVDWEDPSLYDLVINLEHIGIEQACRLVTGMVKEATFEVLPENRTALEDMALASRVRAELALNPYTSNLEVEVDASGGEVSIKGMLFEQSEEVRKVASAVEGVQGLSITEIAPAS